MIKVNSTSDFQYVPPHKALTAKTILIKPNLGYPVSHPVTIDLKVLATVLTTLRTLNPSAKIFLVEGVCAQCSLQEIASENGVTSLLDARVSLLDADELPLKEYVNISPAPVRFQSLWAPRLIEEVDCRISLAVLKRTESTAPLISASLKNLYGLFPRSKYSDKKTHARDRLHNPSVMSVLQDIYFTIGHLFDGAIVGGEKRFQSYDWRPYEGESFPFGKVIHGDDLLAVDRKACLVANETVPSYVDIIEEMRKEIVPAPGT